MANVIIFDPASTPVANRVLRYVRSVQESDYADTPNVLINHDGSGDNPQVAALVAAAVPMSKWKVSGSDVVEMAADDIATIDASGRVRSRPSQELDRKRERARKELAAILANWSDAEQSDINAAVKHIAIILI